MINWFGQRYKEVAWNFNTMNGWFLFQVGAMIMWATLSITGDWSWISLVIQSMGALWIASCEYKEAHNRGEF